MVYSNSHTKIKQKFIKSLIAFALQNYIRKYTFIHHAKNENYFTKREWNQSCPAKRFS